MTARFRGCLLCPCRLSPVVYFGDQLDAVPLACQAQVKNDKTMARDLWTEFTCN